MKTNADTDTPIVIQVEKIEGLMSWDERPSYKAWTTIDGGMTLRAIDSDKDKAVEELMKLVEKANEHRARITKIAKEAVEKKGILYFPDSAEGEVLDCRKATVEEAVSFVKEHGYLDLVPEYIVPEEGVKYAVLVNIGDGPGYGDKTMLVPLDEITLI